MPASPSVLGLIQESVGDPPISAEVAGPHDEDMNTTQTARIDVESSHGTGQPPSQPPMLNISRVMERLWTGGDLSHRFEQAATTIREWHRLGIRHIVDSRVEWSDEELVLSIAPEMRYLHAGVDDAGQRMPDRWFETVTQFASESLEFGGGVVIHCHMGINRGPSAAYAVLLSQGWDPIDAIDVIRIARPIAAVGYAEDALDWWHRTNGIDDPQRREDQVRLEQWRIEHPHDTVRIIREIRATEHVR